MTENPVLSVFTDVNNFEVFHNIMKPALTKTKEKIINPFVIKSPLHEHINKHMI